MTIVIKNETDRIPAAIEYCRKKIEEIDISIAECDYTEDVNGKLIYSPGSYTYEKCQHENEKRQWEIMLDILTDKTPVSILDW